MKVVLTKYFRNIQGVEFEDICSGNQAEGTGPIRIYPSIPLKLFRGKKDNVKVEHYYHDKDIDDTAKPFSQNMVSLLVMITTEEIHAEDARVEAENKAQLEAAAAKAGLTVEAYQEEQERQQERARKDRGRWLPQQTRKPLLFRQFPQMKTQ